MEPNQKENFPGFFTTLSFQKGACSEQSVLLEDYYSGGAEFCGLEFEESLFIHTLSSE